MISRRDMLGAAAMLAISPARAAPPLRAGEDVGLGAIAAARGILFGTASARYELADADYVRALTRDAAILVCEYEMKRKTTEPEPGRYDFSGADALYAFAAGHGMKMRGHTLVWHAANPPWLENILAAKPSERLLTDYIGAMARHFRGRMNSWDVVNEALLPAGGRPDNLRDTLWLKAFGPSYIDTAFHAAKAADPKALLVYNDWGCEAGAAQNDRFRAATLNFLDGLIARRVPVEAYGMQGHLSAFGAGIDQKKLAAFLDELQARGLAILITEHDVDDSGGPSDIGLRDRACADASRRFLDCVLGNKAVSTVLTWGLSDRYLDPPDWRARLKGYWPRTLPLDRAMRKKPLWSALAEALAQRRA